MAKQITLNNEQTRVLNNILNFIDSTADRVFILKGYAGTGKTTLLRYLIKEIERRGKQYQLLAPTGRAAKVMDNIAGAGVKAKTIHSMIYSFAGLNEEKKQQAGNDVEAFGQLFLNFEPVKTVGTESKVYIVDEASMIADLETTAPVQARFGTGKLLTELMEYDNNAASKFIFVGDPCQLPPVEQYFSPALMPDYFRHHFNVGVQEAQLTQIMRQDDDSDIVTASKSIRSLWKRAPENAETYGNSRLWGKLPFRYHRDIKFVDDKADLISGYVDGIRQHGLDHGVVICRSNKACNDLSAVIRQMLGLTPGTVQQGDLLLVSQNNLITGLANGDMVVVKQVSDYVKSMAGLTFRSVSIQDLATGSLFDTWLIEDILFQERPNLDKAQQNALCVDFIMRMRHMGIEQNTENFYSRMMNDPYMNALRCTYGYAVTCQKAQGGEWNEVYIDMPRNITLNPTKANYQWVYTAMTRTRKTLHLVSDFFYE